MSVKIFKDNTFPRHVSDLMNLMHMVVFNGTDGEEKWDTYLNLKQKEYVALGLARYYQCDHCVEHHTRAVKKTDKVHDTTLSKNINSIILFLRTDIRTITTSEKEQWIESWKKFSRKIAIETSDDAIPYLIGLAIGIARNDDFLIQFCGNEVKLIFNKQNIDLRKAVGELESVVIFMKAAVSKNRITDKLEQLLE